MSKIIFKLELVGLPGSGKTTYLNDYVRNNSLVVPVSSISRVKRYLFAMIYCLTHLFTAFKIAKVIIREYKLLKHPGLKHKIFFIFFSACAREMMGKLAVRCVVDEGLCQFIFSAYEHEVSYEEVMHDFAFLAKRKQLWKIVFMQTDAITRGSRYEIRGRKFRDYIGDSLYQQKFQEVVIKNNEVIKKFFLENFNCKLVKN